MNHRRPVVVVTGAGAGAGRAIARRFGREGWRVALLSREPERLRRRARGDRGARRRGARAPHRHGRCRRRCSPPATGCWREWGDDRRLDQLRDGHRRRPDREHRARRLQARRRRHPARLRLRHAGGAGGHAAARPRRDRADRLRARLSRDPAAIGVLQLQVRDPRLHRFAARRAAASPARSITVSMLQMPGMNTIQFDWARNLFDHKYQPVGAVFDPRRRGRGRLAGGARGAARVLGRRQRHRGDRRRDAVPARCSTAWLRSSGYEQQISHVPETAGRPDNLYQPVKATWRARGRFSRARQAARIHPERQRTRGWRPARPCCCPSPRPRRRAFLAGRRR